MSSTLELDERFLGYYEDPREEAGFRPEWWPSVQLPEGEMAEGVRELRAKFSAVYARRNACAVRIAELPAGDPQRDGLVRQCLFLTEAIDHLEDAGTPIGFIAEPVLESGMFARELVFTHARIATPEVSATSSSFSLYIPIEAHEEGDADGA